MSLENIVPDVEAVDGGNDDQILDQVFYNNVALTLRERIEQCGSRVPVVTGLSCISIIW